ncbi:hypothetical protein TrLO_g5409 [Triparma laevis f. longispina]|uniref:Uncharacterized protein n=1 Tax=Triparma laevis f. longispina TaxID=1714387 RepID=A0A9W7FLE1_9STRA|nr:hypothetical protein TrLO_g5409 [Triparma laevis f. longispina]
MRMHPDVLHLTLLLLFTNLLQPTYATAKFTVKACVATSLTDSCTLQTVGTKIVAQPVDTSSTKCEDTVDQKGSVTWADLILPVGKVLLVEVQTKVASQTSGGGFFVRPSRKTREWGKPTVANKKASFYLADKGQFSVEFASQEYWQAEPALSFDALMLFVNPELVNPVPSGATVISDSDSSALVDLGPNKNYVFSADNTYDWGADKVFKVHDNTEIHFEAGAHVRARIVQTEKKVENVLISGYGTLDTHYDLEPDVVGVSDDATHQTIGIYGKNIRVVGLTIVNTNPTCAAWGYCLNINANWSPIGVAGDPFEADELQDQTMPAPTYKTRQAHCQEKNMDDSDNTNFDNCPTSHEDGQTVSFVKCMTWQMGQDGINAGKYGTVENSFVRVIDDAIKPWDSHGVYKNITIWQQALGWPINFGWWNWNQPDLGTVVEDIYVIHNHNWHTSAGWPETASGQCVIGGIYGSGSVKSGYKLKNIYVETAASCAVGLEISKSAYSRHPTADGCVGSIVGIEIDGLFFDEEFKTGTGYGNYLSGETSPYGTCTGDLSGEIKNLKISSNVAGRGLLVSDFTVVAGVIGLDLSKAVDGQAVGLEKYVLYEGKNTYVGAGAEVETDVNGVVVGSVLQCLERCHCDWSCDCVVWDAVGGECSKRQGCAKGGVGFDADADYDVYVRVFGDGVGGGGGGGGVDGLGEG